MELAVEEFVEGLLNPATHEQPSDSVKASELVLELPPWYDEKKFRIGQKFYWDNIFGCMISMMSGLITVIAVPSILKVLVHTRRSSSSYTAYKRYLSTILHVVSWHRHTLEPGSESWKSLYAVRSRHLRAGLSAKSAGLTHISQRDIALTQFGFLGFTMLKPEELGIMSYDEDAWEGLIHFWRTVGHMLGLKDKYNICRATPEETRAVCRHLLERVFTPCLTNAPEPFEHMAYVLIDGLWAVNPFTEWRSKLYLTRYLAEVPGYVYTEKERIQFKEKLLKLMKPGEEGVDIGLLVQPAAVEGLSAPESSVYKPREYSLLESVPPYRQLTNYQKFKLDSMLFSLKYFYTTQIGRLFYNLNLYFTLWLMKNWPFLAFPRFGFKRSFVNMFVETEQDDTRPKSNKESLTEQAADSWWNMFFPFALKN